MDVEWASASSPNATVELASCADTDTNFGAFIALENLLTTNAAPPAIMSLSYGSPESENGSDGNAYINSLYQLAAFRGVSLFVSTGDADAAVTDQGKATATHGINVNALASTPNNVAVGGTDFADTFLGETSTYWNSSNGPSYNSAISYVPEIPWNDSCASELIGIALGYGTTYGADGACNSAIGIEYFLSTAGGSGGPSGCAYGDATIYGAVSGTCRGYAKPSYQKLVFGNPADGVRDLPDVSLFAANGVFGHYYVLCYTDAAGGGTPCNTPPSSWNGAGGTSFAAPIMAGIQSLINQATGSAQGNPDLPVLSSRCHAVWRSRQQDMRFDTRQRIRSRLHLPRHHVRRQQRRLQSARRLWKFELLLSGNKPRAIWRDVYFQYILRTGFSGYRRLRFRDGHRKRQCL